MSLLQMAYIFIQGADLSVFGSAVGAVRRRRDIPNAGVRNPVNFGSECFNLISFGLVLCL